LARISPSTVELLREFPHFGPTSRRSREES
jgi:hypothetical protein